MLRQAILMNMTNATSSPESGVGPSHSGLRAGPIVGLFGQDPVHANLSARQAKALGLLTSGIYGRPSIGSLKSAPLQQSLASKLRAKLAETGWPLYATIWKNWDMEWGPPICALRASARPTFGSAFTGLPTPSGTSNHGKNHVAGRMDEWGGSSNPFRGTELGKVHSPGFEMWVMGYPAVWRELMPPAMPSSRKSRKPSSNP